MKNAKINIASLFYVEFSWHGFMKIVAGTTSIFLLGFPYFRNTDSYRNKEVCVEIQYCFIQTLLVIDLSTLKLSIWVLPGFFPCFSIRIISTDFFFCFSKLLNGFKSRNHIVICPSKACTKNVIPIMSYTGYYSLRIE